MVKSLTWLRSEFAWCRLLPLGSVAPPPRALGAPGARSMALSVALCRVDCMPSRPGSTGNLATAASLFLGKVWQCALHEVHAERQELL